MKANISYEIYMDITKFCIESSYIFVNYIRQYKN